MDTLEQRAELIAEQIESDCYCEDRGSGFAVKRAEQIILAALKDAREEGRRETERNSSLGGTDWEDL
jgi:uncharacterized protein (UPF0335 family)